MAEYPALVKSDLAAFSGRPSASYPEVFTSVALFQATLLFKIATCLAVWPDDPTSADLARMAVLAMADDIVLKQPYERAKASPFNTESIGSYSYSKSFSKAGVKVTKGESTNVMWFDLAVERIGVCDLVQHVAMTGGIEVFEYDLPRAMLGNGNKRLLGPKDIVLARRYGFDPAPGYGGAGAGLPISVEIEYDPEFVEDPDNPGYYFARDE